MFLVSLCENNFLGVVGGCLDKEGTIIILNPGGNSSVGERHLAKVKVAGSNPVSRSFLSGGIAKWKGNGLQNRYPPVRIRVPP